MARAEQRRQKSIPQLPFGDEDASSEEGRAVGMQLKAGTRLRSATDACEVVVVRAPAEPVDLRCGGHPMLADRRRGDATEHGSRLRPGHAAGQALRRRGARPGGAVHQGRAKARSRWARPPLAVKGAKPLPASD